MTENLQIAAVSALFLLLCLCIAASARKYMRPKTAETLRSEQQQFAEFKAVEWSLVADQAQAMAEMFDRRAKRLAQPVEVQS